MKMVAWWGAFTMLTCASCLAQQAYSSCETDAAAIGKLVDGWLFEESDAPVTVKTRYLQTAFIGVRVAGYSPVLSAWCLDYTKVIGVGTTVDARAYNAFASTFPPELTDIIGTNPAVVAKIVYLINTYRVGGEYGTDSNICRGSRTVADVQNAIWTVLGECGTSTCAYPVQLSSTSAEVLPCVAHVRRMVTEATAKSGSTVKQPTTCPSLFPVLFRPSDEEGGYTGQLLLAMVPCSPCTNPPPRPPPRPSPRPPPSPPRPRPPQPPGGGSATPPQKPGTCTIGGYSLTERNISGGSCFYRARDPQPRFARQYICVKGSSSVCARIKPGAKWPTRRKCCEQNRVACSTASCFVALPGVNRVCFLDGGERTCLLHDYSKRDCDLARLCNKYQFMYCPKGKSDPLYRCPRDAFTGPVEDRRRRVLSV